MIWFKIYVGLLILGFLFLFALMFLTPRITKLPESNRFRKWWEKHIVTDEPDVK